MIRRFYKTVLVKTFHNLSFLPGMRKLRINKKKKNRIENKEKVIKYIDEADKVYLNLTKVPLVGLIVTYDDELIDPEYDNKLRYESFLNYNKIPYKKIDIQQSDWLQQTSKCDIIIWGLYSNPARLEEERTKLYFLEIDLGKICYPSFREAYLYEDKIRFYYFCKIHNLPIVNTFITNNEDEATSYINTCKYPIVSKLTTGSGSRGVRLMKSKNEAKKHISSVFSRGNSTYYTYVKQKDYIYYQDYYDDCKFDLRVIVIGNMYTGYYRMRPKYDFRASGGGIYEKKPIPEEALRIAMETKQKMNASMLAVDMIKSEAKKRFEIIEGSIFFAVRTHDKLLLINDTPGFYHYENDKFTFKEGRFWVQHLALKQVFETWEKKSLKI